MGMDYKSSGVDIEAGYESVELMKQYVKRTMREEVLGGIGGFSGGVLNVMFTALIGSVLSVAPALAATFICVLRRIIANLIAGKRP